MVLWGLVGRRRVCLMLLRSWKSWGTSPSSIPTLSLSTFLGLQTGVNMERSPLAMSTTPGIRETSLTPTLRQMQSAGQFQSTIPLSTGLRAISRIRLRLLTLGLPTPFSRRRMRRLSIPLFPVQLQPMEVTPYLATPRSPFNSRSRESVTMFLRRTI